MLFFSPLFFIFFFFQAEDGIRDTSVTGVQTCALPILSFVKPPFPGRIRSATKLIPRRAIRGPNGQIGRACVGKECRSRWSPDHEKKKKKRTRDRIDTDSEE